MNLYLDSLIIIMFAQNAAAHYEQAEECFERAKEVMK